MREELEIMRKEIEEVKEESDLYRILKMEDKKHTKLCIIIALLIILLVISVSYTIYLHKSINTKTVIKETYDMDAEKVLIM